MWELRVWKFEIVGILGGGDFFKVLLTFGITKPVVLVSAAGCAHFILIGFASRV